MSRKGRCTICNHPQLDDINRALIEKSAPYRTIAHDFGVSEDALKRHKKNHLPKDLVRSQEVKQEVRAKSIWQFFEDTEKKVREIIARAEEKQSYSVVMSGLKELRELVKLQAQLQAMAAQQGESVEIDLEALTRDIRDYLKAHHPKAYRGLVDHLKAEYERLHPQPTQE